MLRKRLKGKYLPICSRTTSTAQAASPSGQSYCMQGLYGQGKSGEKGLVCFGQGKSGTVREACSGQGQNSIFILQVREIFIFHHQRGMYRTLITR